MPTKKGDASNGRQGEKGKSPGGGGEREWELEAGDSWPEIVEGRAKERERLVGQRNREGELELGWGEATAAGGITLPGEPAKNGGDDRGQPRHTWTMSGTTGKGEGELTAAHDEGSESGQRTAA
ncbi:hypothetical protein NL676_030437 [Syzygium grande]|nr:hypothetical protein NL676_030437 [Syzygium grande]